MERTRWLVLAAFVCAAGCYCWQPAHRSEAKCIVTHQVVDCTRESLNVLEPAAMLIIADLLNGTSIDWNAVLDRLEGFGFKEAGCLLAMLENDFMQTPAAQRPDAIERIARIHAELIALKRRHKGEYVRFRVKRPDGTVSEL
jgi:hypothetical protein